MSLEDALFQSDVCVADCLGCNEDRCCWDMAAEDFREGQRCNCLSDDMKAEDVALAAHILPTLAVNATGRHATKKPL